jgi:hypothetical protein
MNSVLKQKITASYDQPELLLEVIRKHGAETFLNNVFQLITEFTDQKSENELLTLSSTILTKLNDVLLTIDDDEERRMIKYAITDIFKTDIRAVSKRFSDSFIPSLINTLKTSSFLLNNNYKELESLLGLKRYAILKSKRFASSDSPYYDWLGRDYELDELIRDLKDKDIIYSIKDFKKLFMATGHSFFEVNVEKLDDLIIIFSILYDLNLIQAKRKSGHFSPLTHFGVDNQQNLLFTKPPNKIHYGLKQKGRWYDEVRENHESWIKSVVAL